MQSLGSSLIPISIRGLLKTLASLTRLKVSATVITDDTVETSHTGVETEVKADKVCFDNVIVTGE